MEKRHEATWGASSEYKSIRTRGFLHYLHPTHPHPIPSHNTPFDTSSSSSHSHSYFLPASTFPPSPASKRNLKARPHPIPRSNPSTKLADSTVSHIDGSAIAKLDGKEVPLEDSDEPPIPRPPDSYLGNLNEKDRPGRQSGPRTALRNITTASNSFVSGRSDDGTLSSSWDGATASAHVVDATDITSYLEVDPTKGITTTEASARLTKYGHNQLDDAGKVSIGEILLRQVSNSLTIVLLIAMALSYGTLDFIEGAVITAVILLNIILGFVQDFRAEKTMQSLLGLAAPSSQVVRNDGRTEIVKAETLVPGDIVKLANGVVVPADLRLLESTNLEIDEALLTGESLPSSKNAQAPLASLDVPIGDRINMAYSACTVTRGRGTGIVVATGMKTEVGSVAALLRGQAKATHSNIFVSFFQKFWHGLKNILGLVGTPMQVKLSKFAILLFGLAILLAIIVFSANKWNLDNEVVLYGICVAVAVIPESLIAVMTITIAVGVKAMAQGHVVVRRMAALEAIGGVTHIFSDKTGTLTQGKMVAHKVWVPGMGVLSIKETTNILDPQDGKLDINNEPLDKSDVAAQKKLLQLRPVMDAAGLCNFATVYRSEAAPGQSTEKLPTQGDWVAIGDPTEIALQVLAMRFGRGKDALLNGNDDLAAVTEHQFDSSLKRMSVAYKHRSSGKVEVYAKGASEAILPILSISEAEQAELTPILDKLANEGLRVLCIAAKVVPESDEARLEDRAFAESGLKLQGLIGLYDPPRIETLGAVQKCHQAGISVHMLTGDHLATATAIAKQVGILSSSAPVSSGAMTVMKATDFDNMSDSEIDQLPALPVVLARCSPTTKVRMVDALQRRQGFCVMTGDGVNDAPALKRAHVGIAMGINGTDVAKDSSDMILTDDNFASIVRAVEEGRRLFDNIQKFLMHLLISNIAQVILLLIALAFKDQEGNSVFPLSPLEILWVNMITSSFLAIGLGMEEAQADIMTRPPRDLKAGVFTWELIIDKFIYGTFAGVLCLASFIIVVYGTGNGNLGNDCNHAYNSTCDVVFEARATVFAVLSFLLLVTAWEVKHFSRSLFNLDPARYSGKASFFKALVYNRFLLWAVVAGFLITFPVIYIPVVNEVVFKHLGITWQWGIVFGALVLYVALVESWKAVKRRFGIYSGKDTLLATQPLSSV